MSRHPISEAVYDAALRCITRDERPDDARILEAWYGVRQPAMTHREIALEVIREVGLHGYGRRCVD